MSEWKQTVPSVIVTQAGRSECGIIVPCVGYRDVIMIKTCVLLHEATGKDLSFKPGWIDQFGNWFNRDEVESMVNHLDNAPVDMRVVVCAARKYKDHIFAMPRHTSPVFRAWFLLTEKNKFPRNFPKSSIEQGFLDQHGIYMDRVEALAIATAASQIGKRRPKGTPLNLLFSEDLY